MSEPHSLRVAANPCATCHNAGFVDAVYKSIGVKPVCFAIRESMRGPMLSPSWKAKT